MPFKLILIFALLLSNSSEVAAQRKPYLKNYYSVINLAIQSYKRPYKPVADSTIHIDIEECFPSIFSEIHVGKHDSISIRSQIQVQNKYKAKLSGKHLSTPLIKKDSVQLLYSMQMDSIRTKQAVTNIYVRNYLKVSEPVFINKLRAALIRLDKPGGSSIFYLQKKRRRWEILKELCFSYY